MATVGVDDVRRLLHSDQEDAVLVLLQGRPVVITAREQETDAYRGALFIASRRNLLDQGSAADVERLAAVLSDMADRLGA